MASLGGVEVEIWTLGCFTSSKFMQPCGGCCELGVGLLMSLQGRLVLGAQESTETGAEIHVAWASRVAPPILPLVFTGVALGLEGIWWDF